MLRRLSVGGPGWHTVFSVLRLLFGDQHLEGWDYIPPFHDPANPFGRCQRLVAERLVSDTTLSVCYVSLPYHKDDDHPEEDDILPVMRWPPHQQADLFRACAEIGWAVMGLPIHAWFLACCPMATTTTTKREAIAPVFRWRWRTGRALRILQRVLSPVHWEAVVQPPTAEGVADGSAGESPHWDYLTRRRGAERDRGWWVDDDPDLVPWRMCASPVMSGPLLVYGWVSDAWLLPPEHRNLPRSAADLVRVLEAWAQAVHGGPPPPGYTPPPEEPRLRRIQHALDGVHASRDPDVRLALRLNVCRYVPEVRMRFWRDGCCHNHVPQRLSLAYLRTLAAASDDLTAAPDTCP